MNQNIRISFSFNEWLIWFRAANFNHKVFIFYTLVNPIINLLWSVKVPGFGKSVTSMINAVFISYLMISIFLNFKKPSLNSPIYNLINFFCFLFVLKTLYYFFYVSEFHFIEQAIRDLIFYIYFYMLFIVVKNEYDFLMIIRTYLYSYYFIVINFLSGFSSTTRESRGFDRDTLGYYDGTNVALQSVFVLAFLAFLYIYYSENKHKFTKRIHAEIFFLLINCILIIKGSYHILSYLNAGFIFLLFFLNSLKSVKSIVLTSIVFLPIVYIVLTSMNVIETFYKVIVRDFNFAMSGTIPTYLLHGRVKIWSDYVEKYNSLNLFEIITGYYSIPSPHASAYAHNDFLRIFATVGLLGFVTYFLILFLFLMDIRKIKNTSIKWVGFVLLSVTLLFSFTIGVTSYTFVCLPLVATMVFIIKYNMGILLN